MRGGDISNDVAARIIVIFEGGIGHLGDAVRKRHDKAVYRHRWERAAQCWEFSLHAIKVLHDWQHRSPYNVDLATYLPHEEAVLIRDRLDNLAVPFAHFLITNPEEMRRVITNLPQVQAVFDSDPSRAFAYGHKGRTELVL